MSVIIRDMEVVPSQAPAKSEQPPAEGKSGSADPKSPEAVRNTHHVARKLSLRHLRIRAY